MSRPPAIELADVMRAFSGQYLSTYGERMPLVHQKALEDITACRTPKMGGTTFLCPGCQKYHYSYHSCGNRNCNKCQNQRAQNWLDQTGQLLLPVEHFMVTFTLPEPLRALARSHQKLFYGLLMRCAAEALQSLGYDPAWVGGQLAMMGVLHSWSRDLNYHPHVHMIVAGGGLWPVEKLWLQARKDFLMPSKALSPVFAAKFRDGLKKNAPEVFAMSNPRVWKSPWVVHIQNIGNAEHALKYLAQYIFRPAISNKRIVMMADGIVSFSYRDSKTGKWRKMRLQALEFIRRYLQHVLPRGFVKVRYYGLYAHRNRNILHKMAGKMTQNGVSTGDESAPEEGSPRQARVDDDAPQPVTVPSPECPCCGEPMVVVSVVRRGGIWPKAPPDGKKSGLINHSTSPSNYLQSVA